MQSCQKLKTSIDIPLQKELDEIPIQIQRTCLFIVHRPEIEETL